MGINANAVSQAADNIIATLPKVSGSVGHTSNETNGVLLKAEELSKKAGDEYVSVEFILYGLLMGKSNVATLLKDQGMTEKDLELAIADLRKGANVKDQSAEEQYNSRVNML